MRINDKVEVPHGNKNSELRKANKLVELANEMGVTRQTIIFTRKGRYNASLELAFKLLGIWKTIEEVFILRKIKEKRYV